VGSATTADTATGIRATVALFVVATAPYGQGMTTTPSDAAPANGVAVPFVRQVVLDCPDPRRLAEFYRRLLGYAYRAGDETPPVGEPDPRGEDWLVLRPEADDPSSGRGIAFQQTESYVPPTWPTVDKQPATGQQQMLHLDMTVPDVSALTAQRDRATELGATVLLDRSDDDDEPLYVFADPAGHPFCIFVA
jgi:catechol 2,3-dioxygenase-like lactoylglutathione lyase family enzyme